MYSLINKNYEVNVNNILTALYDVVNSHTKMLFFATIGYKVLKRRWIYSIFIHTYKFFASLIAAALYVDISELVEAMGLMTIFNIGSITDSNGLSNHEILFQLTNYRPKKILFGTAEYLRSK